MNTTGGWKRKDYKRQCSICGHPWKFSQLKYIGEGKWACPDDKKGLTATQISRHNARARALKVNAVKHPRPDGVVDIYQLEEAQVFNLVASVSPWNTQADKDNGAAKSTNTAARSAIYMGDILIENTRPAVWLDTAATCLARNVTYLLTQQYGSPTGPAATDATTPRYGGILGATNLESGITALAGLAFLRSYQITGNGDHLAAAGRCATFLRHQQCAWQSSASDQTQYGGGLLKVTGVAAGATTAGALLNTYNISDNGAAVWFFAELEAIVGATQTYGEASSTYFTGSTLATLGQMSQACADFLGTGVMDANAGAIITGLSAATPYQYYVAQTAGSSSYGYWFGDGTLGRSILTDKWAMALFGLHFAGLLPTSVTSVYGLLMGMGANPANSASGLTRDQVYASANGTYDPSVAPAVSVEPASNYETTGTYYSWSAAAWLAAIQSVVAPAAFKAAKDALSKPRRVSVFSQELRYMAPLARSGLSFQVAGLTEEIAT